MLCQAGATDIGESSSASGGTLGPPGVRPRAVCLQRRKQLPLSPTPPCLSPAVSVPQADSKGEAVYQVGISLEIQTATAWRHICFRSAYLMSSWDWVIWPTLLCLGGVILYAPLHDPAVPKEPTEQAKGTMWRAEARAYQAGWTEPAGPEHGVWGPTGMRPAVGSMSCADRPRVFNKGAVSTPWSVNDRALVLAKSPAQQQLKHPVEASVLRLLRGLPRKGQTERRGQSSLGQAPRKPLPSHKRPGTLTGQGLHLHSAGGEAAGRNGHPGSQASLTSAPQLVYMARCCLSKLKQEIKPR